MFPFRSFLLAATIIGVLCGTARAQQPILYIAPTDDGFETYLTAAIHKKHVPVMVSTAEEKADFVLKSNVVEITKESTGSKVAKCIVFNCAGIEDKGTVSVTLNKGDLVVWSYS